MKCPKDFFEEAAIDKAAFQKEQEVIAKLKEQRAELKTENDKIWEQIEQVDSVIDLIENTRHTISFCEKEIAPMIEKAYQENKDCIHLPQCKISTRHGRKVFRKLVLESQKYANGDDSYQPVGDFFDLEKLIEYLSQFCYQVKTEEYSYWLKSYGSGYIDTISITICGIPCALEA